MPGRDFPFELRAGHEADHLRVLLLQRIDEGDVRSRARTDRDRTTWNNLCAHDDLTEAQMNAGAKTPRKQEQMCSWRLGDLAFNSSSIRMRIRHRKPVGRRQVPDI